MCFESFETVLLPRAHCPMGCGASTAASNPVGDASPTAPPSGQGLGIHSADQSSTASFLTSSQSTTKPAGMNIVRSDGSGGVDATGPSTSASCMQSEVPPTCASPFSSTHSATASCSADISSTPALATTPAAAASKITPDGPVIFILGAPGSGKDVQCERLVTKYGCTLLVPGDLLRAAVTSGSSQGEMISNMIRSGQVCTRCIMHLPCCPLSRRGAVAQLHPHPERTTRSDLKCRISLDAYAGAISLQIVPAQVTLDLLKAAMGEQSGPYLIQGWPKTLDNLDAFELQCGACAGAICLQGDEATLTARLLDRGQTSGRTDDSAEAIGRRFQTFKLQCAPLPSRQNAWSRWEAMPLKRTCATRE